MVTLKIAASADIGTGSKAATKNALAPSAGIFSINLTAVVCPGKSGEDMAGTFFGRIKLLLDGTVAAGADGESGVDDVDGVAGIAGPDGEPILLLGSPLLGRDSTTERTTKNIMFTNGTKKSITIHGGKPRVFNRLMVR